MSRVCEGAALSPAGETELLNSNIVSAYFSAALALVSGEC
jgi:hypothetical protein